LSRGLFPSEFPHYPAFVNYTGFKQVQHLASGGVSEHVYDRDPKAYGDIGPSSA
jgi:hypothetical protein